MAYLLGVEVDKIYIYPLGGISKFNMPLNISIKKEFLILISGPLFQFVAYFILNIIFNDKELIKTYHLGILVFNLLPIYPLDGGKLINLLLNCFVPYKLSLKIIIYISYIFTILVFFINNISINLIITIGLLTILIIKEHKKINYKYNKFLLERYINNYKFKNSIIINNINNLYRSKRHIIKLNNKYYLEKEYLSKKYKK